MSVGNVLGERGANCWTDHKLVRAKLSFGLPRMHKTERKLLPFSVCKLSSTVCKDRSHLEKVLQDQSCNTDMSTEEKWSVLKACTVSTAEITIGRGGGSSQSGLKRMLRNSCP